LPLTLDEGKTLVSLARSTLDVFVTEGRFEKKSWHSGYLSVKRGVFTTLNVMQSGDQLLRGCIGFPLPVKPLGEAVQETTVAAASEDPRFPPVRPQELERITVDVSALTVPVPVASRSRLDVPKLIEVGRDGLIITAGFQSGLLLPQVAVEQNWTSDEFLSQTCMKAGLLPDTWLDPKTAIQRFQAEVFAEGAPRGEVKRVPL
jgi:uncharacterized protein (TIGR00296 family)